MTSNTQFDAAAAAVDATAARVSKSTISSAVTALLNYKAAKSSSTEKLQLLPEDEYIYLNLTLKKIPSKSRTNPFKIPLPYPVFDPSSQLCLIIDDRPQSPTPPSDQIKKLIKSHDIPISKVIKVSKLKTNYKPFEAKRKLCDSYDLFLVDKRVVHLLPKLLGKEFFKKKKLPLGVDLGKKNLKSQVERVLEGALLYLRSGTCCVMKVGKVAMEESEVVDNVFDAIKGAVERVVPKKWEGVRSLHLKLRDSVALPLYQAMPDVKLKIEGLREVEKRGDVVRVSDSEGEGKGVGGRKGGDSGSKKKKTKGRIHEVRYMDVGEGIESEDNVENDEFVGQEGKLMEEIDDEIEDAEDLSVKDTVGKRKKKGLSGDKPVKKKAKSVKNDEGGKRKKDVSSVKNNEGGKRKKDVSSVKNNEGGKRKKDVSSVKNNEGGKRKKDVSSVGDGDVSGGKKGRSHQRSRAGTRQ